jgi:hypothetical protein
MTGSILLTSPESGRMILRLRVSFREIVGEGDDRGAHISDFEDTSAIQDAIADAWEQGVDETFEVECERILRGALSE